MCKFGNEKDYVTAIKWLDDNNIPADGRTYSILLGLSTRQNDVKWSEDLLHRMVSNNMSPTNDALKYLIGMYIRLKNANGIEEVSAIIF